VASLPLKSGALQGAIVVDNALNQLFESLHITYDGINGQLPNLDLFNTAVSIASGQMGIKTSLQRMWKHNDSYRERLQTMLRGMTSQGLGHASGPHSSFIPYHVDAITLTAVGLGWHDEMAMGRVIESLFRSLNNLMEHLHQSFFFYILMQANRFVSIGTYLPSAMLVSVNFSIMAIALWIQSGRPPKTNIAVPTIFEKGKKASKPEVVVLKHQGMTTIIPQQDLNILERELFLPVIFVLALHFLGVIPLYIFNNTTQSVHSSLFSPQSSHHIKLTPPQYLSQTLYAFTALNILLPTLLAFLLTTYFPPTHPQRLLIKCFSLLLLGMFLATLATLNFSLAFLIGLLAFPLSFFGVPSANPPAEQRRLSIPESTVLSIGIKVINNVILHTFSPPVVLTAVCWYCGIGVEMVLMQAAFGWRVSGLWTQVIVWCVWWPAWMVGAVFLSPLM
jgi:glycosylphosphatidylinositol transamidase